ncbi:hypothetical protein GS531_22880, partial [Rhodococcus hoagii]|nr:hypothetical protein [Prescottella equi]
MKRTPINTWLDDDVSVSGRHRGRTRRSARRSRSVWERPPHWVRSPTIVGVTTLFGGGPMRRMRAPRAATHRRQSRTSSGSSVLACQETSSSERTQSSGEGDTNTTEGLIVAYEHAFFA